MKRREWIAGLDDDGDIIANDSHATRRVRVISADYVESLEREVAALRACIDGSAIVSKEAREGYVLANRIRDERESGEL